MLGEITSTQTLFYFEMQKAQGAKDEETDSTGVWMLQLPHSSVRGLGLQGGPKPCCCTCLGEPTVGHPGTGPWGWTRSFLPAVRTLRAPRAWAALSPLLTGGLAAHVRGQPWHGAFVWPWKRLLWTEQHEKGLRGATSASPLWAQALAWPCPC